MFLCWPDVWFHERAIDFALFESDFVIANVVALSTSERVMDKSSK